MFVCVSVSERGKNGPPRVSVSFSTRGTRAFVENETVRETAADPGHCQNRHFPITKRKFLHEVLMIAKIDKSFLGSVAVVGNGVAESLERQR